MHFPYRLIDCTHTLGEATPSWDGSCGFHCEVNLDYQDCTEEVKFKVQKLKMHAGIGTHIDAPAHCCPQGMTVDQIDLASLIAPCVVIDISDRAHESYQLTEEDIEYFEKQRGRIQPGVFVFVRTGWEKYWGDSHKYRNNQCFPSVSKSAALVLLQRKIVGLGIDTLSPDRPGTGFPVHQIILGAGRYLIENAANLAQVPVVGSMIIVAPMKIQGGTEAPIRLLCLIPE